MEKFRVLTGYEYKKLFQRKAVWITLLIMMGIGTLAATIEFWGTTFTVDGERVNAYEMLKADISESKKTSGLEIGDDLLDAASDDSRDIPNDIVGFIFQVTGQFGMFNGNAEDMYDLRRQSVEEEWKTAGLSAGEKEYLSELEDKIQIPVVFHYAGGWEKMAGMMKIVLVMQVLLVAVSIPSIFSEEHSRKTDQLNLCTQHGCRMLFGAKVFAGVTFSVISTLLLAVSVAIPVFIVYGFDGFHAAVQQFAPLESWSMTLGKRVFILIFLCVISAVIHCAVGMLLAEKAKTAVAPMAIITGFLIFSMFANVPDQYREIAQLWDYVPDHTLFSGNVFGIRMLHMFGSYFTIWQAAPILWILISVVVLYIGYRLYRNYQVTGR